MKMKSAIIKTTGEILPCNPASARKGWTLEELYTHLSCDTVEVVYPRNPVILGLKEPIIICDENGLGAKEFNPTASMLAGYSLVGDVILTESKSFK